jgi:chloramphenicol-sensitive protein RarD
VITDQNAQTGFFVGFLTQVIWGLLPFYAELFPGTPVAHILVCRVLACAVTMSLLVVLFKQYKDVFALFREPKRLAAYTLAALMLSINWTTFFWAVEHGYVLELSFATYLLPLVSIAMGVIFLRERLTRWMTAGLFVSALGVAAILSGGTEAPFVIIGMAAPFATYTLIRKTNRIAPLAGFGFEVSVIAILAAGYLLLNPNDPPIGSNDSLLHIIWLLSFGPQTAMTMVMFNYAVHHLRLSTSGMLQFGSPTITFVIAALRGDHMNDAKTLGFALIWIGVICYAIDTLRARAAHKADLAATIEASDTR